MLIIWNIILNKVSLVLSMHYTFTYLYKIDPCWILVKLYLTGNICNN